MARAGIVLIWILGLATVWLVPAGRTAGLALLAQERPTVDVGLDAGHSRLEVGAVGGDLREYELTLAWALRVRELLEAEGFSVRMSRENHEPVSAFDDPDPTRRVQIEQEARIAAVVPARVFVSLHLNGHPNASIRGTETYYNGDNNGPDSIRLAEQLQANAVAAIRGAGYPVFDRGIKEDLTAGKPYGHFFSLRGPLPSALVEGLFLTNPADLGALYDPAIREALAQGVTAGLRAHLR